MNKSRSATDKRISQLPNWLWSNSNVLPSSYRRVWEGVREERPHIGPGRSDLLVDTKKVFPLLLTSQLPTEVLGYIWGLANQKYAGKLTEQELYVVLALVAVAQTSYPFTNLEVLHLLPGPPEPRLNLALIYPNASQISSHQEVLVRRDSFSGKHEIQVRPGYKTSSAASGTAIPGLVPNHSHMGETRIDSKIPASLSRAIIDTTAEPRGASPAQSDGKMSHSLSSADSNDDFSDFQSAPPAVSQTTLNVPMWDSKQGSAIGSRLANHNLGVKKTSDKQRKGSSVGGGGSKVHNLARVLPSAAEQMTVTLTLGAGKELLPSVERLGEIFPKCAIKSQAKTVILKDTVIRNGDPPKQMKESVSCGIVDKAETPFRQLSAKFVTASSSRSTESSPLDLMNLQQVEDKYSALRVLVEEPNVVDSVPEVEAIASVGAFPQSDDFGDFVSAQQPESSNTSLVGTSTTLGFDDTSDLFGDFDRFRSAQAAKKVTDVSANVDTVGEAFSNLEIEANPNSHPLEEKSDGSEVVEAEKVTPKEDTISVNSIDLGDRTVGVITRSNSVPSLDLKSFLSPSADDDQQTENMHQLIYWEWKQYMESCVNLLQAAANVFGSITSDVVLQEVLASAQGYNFLCNLAEVAAVCRRVNFSHKEMDINIIGFDDLLMDIDRIWAEMEPFYANIPIVTELPVWPLHQGESSACCALCLTIVTSGRIVYNDNNYHVTCANLWLNCVNHNLPTLRYPPSSFVSHSMPIAATGNNQI